MGVSLLFLHRNLINFRRDTLYIVFVGYIPYHLMTGLSANQFILFLSRAS